MIVKKVWHQRRHAGNGTWIREGWYLFGIIPLYIRDMTERYVRT